MTTAQLPAPFALGVFGAGGSTGLVRGDRVLDVSGLGTVSALLADWDASFARLAAAAENAADEDWGPLAGLEVRCPLEPRQILQCGANYRKHVVDIVLAERRADASTTGHNSDVSEAEARAWAERMMDERARTGSPFFFAGLPAAMCGPDDDVLLPPEAAQVDWEAELAVVIGATARRVPRERALDYVAGFTVCNDISARDLQFPAEHRPLGGDWIRAKNRPTFLPTGPFLVPADQVGDHRDLEITFELNGERLQQDMPRNMLFDLPTLIAAASAATTLLPGDLILTGSPAGNGGHWGRWLQPGDVMVTAISGLGTQRNTCVLEDV